MTLDEFIEHRLAVLNFIHDLSIGALLSYHKVRELDSKEQIFFDKDSIIMLKKSNWMEVFVYNENVPRGVYTQRHENLKITINSPTPLVGLKLKSKQKEVFYQLEDIESHTGKKKYHSLIKPIRIFEERPDLSIELRDFEAAGQASLKELHDEWVKYKLSLPTTHRISFPTARYRNTITLEGLPTYKKAIFIRNELYGFIVFSIENGVAFELSFVSHFWKDKFKVLNGLNQYIFSYCLIQLQKQGVRFVNSGFALNKKLEIFKKTSQSAVNVFRYTYEV